MKIDLHCHTKNVRKGEDDGRNVDAISFATAMKDSRVGIVGITNHNHFDKEQFELFSKVTKNTTIVLPGIELDVFFYDQEKESSKKQMNVIVDPNSVGKLIEISSGILQNKKFMIQEVINHFKNEKCIYYLDYKSDNKFNLKEIDKFKKMTDSPVIVDSSNHKTNIVLKFYSYSGLIGSDVKEWKHYVENSEKLLSLNWKINSFEKLYLLLKHDIATIQELIEKTSHKEVTLSLGQTKEVKDTLKIKIFEGLNVIFGGKGTGKSEMLKSIRNQNVSTNAYYAASEKDDSFKEKYPAKPALPETIKSQIEKYEEKVVLIKNFEEPKIEIKIFGGFENYFKNKESDNFRLQNASTINVALPDTSNHETIFEKIKNLKIAMQHTKIVDLSVEQKIFEEAIIEFENHLRRSFMLHLKEYWKTQFINNVIEVTKNVLHNRQGVSPKPSKIGLFNFWEKRMKIKNELEILLKFFSETFTPISGTKIDIPGKGLATYVSAFKIIKESDTRAEWTPKTGGKENFKAFISNLNNFISHPLKIFELEKPNSKNYLQEIKDYLTKNEIKLINFILSKAEFQLENNEIYPLSDGEKALAVVLDELQKNKEYYLLDEPSLFVGNQIVNENLRNRLWELKLANKKIVIVTHDPNLGLNTLPINMVYRQHVGNNKFETYFGNIISDNFTENTNQNPKTIKAKKIITDSFEGGLNAFEFRKELYESKN